MCYSKTHTIASGAQRPSPDVKSLSLPPQLPELPFLVDDGPLNSQPPQLPDLSFALRRSNAVRRSAMNESVQLSSAIRTQADIEAAVVPEPPTNKKRRRQKSPVRNFSLPTHHPKQPLITTRYYAAALTLDDHVALAQGEENHNHKLWTSKDRILFKESSKELMPTNMYMGPDKQLLHEYRTEHPSSAISISSPQNGPIARARARAHSRATSTESYPINGYSTLYSSSRQLISRTRVRSQLTNEVTTCNSSGRDHV